MAPKSKPAVLTAAAILAAQDSHVEAVNVPEWGGDVYLKRWTAGEREAFERGILKPDGTVDRSGFRHRVVAATICDDAGALLFPGNLDALKGKAAAVVDRLFGASDRINAITGDAAEELEKN